MIDEIESRMWNLLKTRSGNEQGREVRIGYYACNQLPVHKHRATDIVKSWDNRGLVVARQNGARACLTQKGQSLDELKQTV